jgi:hypothetical protein
MNPEWFGTYFSTVSKFIPPAGAQLPFSTESMQGIGKIFLPVLQVIHSAWKGIVWVIKIL